MFTGPQGINRKVRARAVIITDSLAANSKAIFAVGLRICNHKFREDRHVADVFESKSLFLGELFPQGNLPLF